MDLRRHNNLYLYFSKHSNKSEIKWPEIYRNTEINHKKDTAIKKSNNIIVIIELKIMFRGYFLPVDFIQPMLYVI